jgi:hypothetical protein
MVVPRFHIDSRGSLLSPILLSKKKVQSLDFASCLWPTLMKFPLTTIVQDNYDIIIKYSKPCLSSLQNYSWFMQYMNCDNDNPLNA